MNNTRKNINTAISPSSLVKLPLYVQKIFGRTGGFKNYAVKYRSETEIRQHEQNASKCNVTLNDGAPLDISNTTETCKGKIIDCFVYLIDYLESDDGYNGGKTMFIDDLSNITNTELGDFCIWIYKWLPEWLEGMKYNRQLSSKVNVIYGLEESKPHNENILKNNFYNKDSATMKYSIKQIQESIKYWQKQLRLGNYRKINESYKVSLADKKSVTAALLKHNDELFDFANKTPHPTKDELIDFVANIFKEEGLDTPWTRQFLIRMKMYTHGYDDAIQYLYNARLKGEGFGMDVGIHETDEYNFNKYFIQMFKCFPDGQIDDTDVDDGKELKQYYPEIGIDRFFNSKNEAIRAAKSASKKLLDLLNAEFEIDDDTTSRGNPFTSDDYHVLAILRQGDEYESDVVACFIDGVLSSDVSISSQLNDVLDESKETDEAPTKEQLLSKKDKARAEAAKVTTSDAAKKFLDKHQDDITKLNAKLKGDAKKDFSKIVSFMQDFAKGKKLDESTNDVLLKIVFGCAGVISFMCGLNTIAWIILSPIVGPLLHETVKRLSGIK